MEALLVEEIPEGEHWQYEPKWDGFRCIAFRDGDSVELQSKAGQPLARYFPEVVASLRALSPPRFVLDGDVLSASRGRLEVASSGTLYPTGGSPGRAIWRRFRATAAESAFPRRSNSSAAWR
jgi:hypothetical protein